MPSVTEASQQLSKFRQHDDVQAILNNLFILEMPEVDERIEALRNQLSRIVSDDNNNQVKDDDLSLSEAAYNVLIALAEYRPINDIDPVTQDSITEGNHFFAQTGHQYDIHSLVRWFLAKEEYYNILANIEFSPRDQVRIKQLCIEKKY